MNANNTFKVDSLAFAMINYDNKTRHRFTLIDLAVMESILSNTYTTDIELSKLAMCSLSTVKRSINKLCDFGLIKKHLAHDNTKTLILDQDTYNIFVNTYFYAEPYYSEYKELTGAL